MILLELENATVVRGGRRILDGLTLQFLAGRHTAIMGPNGSGKSSLIRLITRDFYPIAPTNGKPPIRIMGHERWDVAALRTQLGIVTKDIEQAFSSIDSRTGQEVVLSGFFASNGIYKHHEVTGEMQRRAEHAMALMEARHLPHKPINEMSTGEARRILIARALVPSPRALLLDEPTAGLDLVGRRRFLERLRLIAQEGKTIVRVTHHIEEILPEIQHVILLKEGRIFMDAPKTECLTGPVMSKLLDAPVRVNQSGGYYSAEVG